MIIITLPDHLNKITKICDDATRWCYMGKDFTKRKKIASTLKSERFYFKDRIYKIAQRKRQSYLDFVAKLGKEQQDQLNWWASKFASKSPFHTDFFLLACYETLIMEIIDGKTAVDDEKLIIFIEDPWLFVETKELSRNENVRFIGSPNLLLNKFLCIARGLVYRFLLLGWFISAKSFTRYCHRGIKPEATTGNKNGVAIINPADVRAFKDGKYVSAYMPGLYSFYEKNGIPCFFIYPFPFDISTAKYLGRNQKILWPLLLEVRFLNVMKRIFERWRPAFDGEEAITLDGSRFPCLLEREKWLTFSKVGFNLYLIQFDAFNSFFKKKWCSHVIYLFENQPWEKMLCMAAAKNNVKTIGYQHSSFSKLYISHFIGKGEEEFVPLPYRIVTVGDHFAQLFKEGGIPEDKIVVGGTWRYGHLLDAAKDETHTSKGSPKKQTILVSLPLDSSILNSMIKNLLSALPQKWLNEKVELWLKPHPVTDRADLAMLDKLSPVCRIVHKPLNELLDEVDLVVASTSTTGLEAFLYGKRVVSFIPENIIDPDPLLDITEEEIYKWYEGEDLGIDFLLNLPSTSRLSDLEQIKKRYFAEINRDVWLNLLTPEN